MSAIDGNRQASTPGAVATFDTGTNVVTFSNTNNPPNTYWWGVSDVTVE